MYADDPVDVLFAHIEGSAKAVMDDGTTVWLEFDGKNGRAYKGVGGVLKEMGELDRAGQRHDAGHPQVVRRSPEQVRRGRRPERVVRVLQGVEARPARSARKTSCSRRGARWRSTARSSRTSTPIWVDATRAESSASRAPSPCRQLLIAQDTGGGILGAVRGDIYWGDDAAAEDLGGRMGGQGRYWLLLPKGVTK